MFDFNLFADLRRVPFAQGATFQPDVASRLSMILARVVASLNSSRFAVAALDDASARTPRLSFQP